MPRARLLVLASLILALPLAWSLEAAPAGQEVYRAACAACHGIDGRGSPPAFTALEVEPADLTDCSFASREADADWISVVHEGGPARAFAREMPAFGGALTRSQIQSALDYARSFCGDDSWPRGELNFPRALATEKAFPEDEVVLTTSATMGGSGNVANKLIYERRLGSRSQFELIVPFGWREQERSGTRSPWTGGVGDLTLGMKHVVHHSLARGSIVSVAGEVKLPTGSENRGFGSGATVFEPFLAFGQRLPANSFLHLQTGAELPVNSDRANEAFLRLAGGRTFRTAEFGRSWTPMLEILGAAELESSRRVQWDVLPQIQFSISPRQHLLGCAGVRFPVNDRDRSDPQLVVYLLWDWFDGGLTDGW
jgi:hypothetical protein